MTVQCPEARRFGFKTRRSTAQTTIEFARIGLPFFSILVAIVDYAQIYFYDNALQNGLRKCCRFITTESLIEATYGDGNPEVATMAAVEVKPSSKCIEFLSIWMTMS